MERHESLFVPIVTEREKGLPFYVTTIGRTEDEAEVYRPRGIDWWQLLYSEEGSGTVELYDKEYTVAEGSLLVLRPNVPHNYHKNGAVWRTSWITFGGWAAAQFFDVESGITRLPEGFGFSERLDKIASYRYSGKWPHESSSRLYSLLLDCREVILEGASAACGLGSRLTECFRYINADYGKPITLGELAELCGVSQEHFCRLFRSYTGMRPFDYITRLRIQRSKDLLARSRDMRIAEVAARTGFQSNSYFSMVFKRSEGCTPDEYRRRVSVGSDG